MKPATKELWTDRLAAMKHLPSVGRLVWQSSRPLVVGGLLARVIVALIPVAILSVSKLILDRVVEFHSKPDTGLEKVWSLLVAEFAIAAVGLGLGPMIDYFDSRLADEFTKNISLRVIGQCARLDLAYFEDAAFYDKLERARVQATDRVAILNAMGTLVQRVIALVSLAAGVIWYSPGLFLLLFVCVLPTFLGESHFAFLGYSLAHELTPTRRELDYLRFLGSSREHAKEIKAFALAGSLHERYKVLSEQIIRNNTQLTRRRLGWGSVLMILGSLGYYGGYVHLVSDAIRGKISVGTLTFLAGAIAGANAEMRSLFSLFSNISEQSLFLTDLIQFLAVRPKLEDSSKTLPPPRPMRDAIEFKNVSFAYPGSDKRVLDQLNFRIAAGERIALVGENGEGKTTLVKLLARLYDPTEGTILLDGVDLREYKLDELRKQIGILFQDFVRYDMPVRSNIGFGRVELIQDDSAIWDAAKRSRVDEIVSALPSGLEQMLGHRFEAGVDLSGGQWQRIALARAYLRDAQILILDEPTSALDAMAEAEVFEKFDELTKDRTSLLISHRFSTVRMADRIVVLSKGKVKEEGTHDRLVAGGGDYARLFETQAANYR
jgi:ATP-binding cassette subfamily B protein